MSSKFLLAAIVATLFTLTAPTPSCAQIIDVGNGVFTKCFVVNTPNGGILKAKHEVLDDSQLLYFDNERNIRKYIIDYEYPDSKLLVAAGYNLSGNLTSVVFNISVPEGVSCHGSAKISYGESGKPIFDYNVQYSRDYGEWESEANISDHLPEEVLEELRISDYININNLKKSIDIKEFSIPKSCKKITFRRPQKEDMALLNSFYIGKKVKIIDIETDNMSNISYIIKHDENPEYIESCYFEDVEEEVKNNTK